MLQKSCSPIVEKCIKHDCNLKVICAIKGGTPFYVMVKSLTNPSFSSKVVWLLEAWIYETVIKTKRTEC